MRPECSAEPPWSSRCGVRPSPAWRPLSHRRADERCGLGHQALLHMLSARLGHRQRQSLCLRGLGPLDDGVAVGAAADPFGVVHRVVVCVAFGCGESLTQRGKHRIAQDRHGGGAVGGQGLHQRPQALQRAVQRPACSRRRTARGRPAGAAHREPCLPSAGAPPARRRVRGKPVPARRPAPHRSRRRTGRPPRRTVSGSPARRGGPSHAGSQHRRRTTEHAGSRRRR